MYFINALRVRDQKTLPEAQRTQGIESVTWIMFSNWFQSEIWFKLQTQYPGSVLPLAMFSMAVSWRIVCAGIKTAESSAAMCAHSAYISLHILTKLKHSETRNILHHSQAWGGGGSKSWNLVQILKFWNLVKVLKFGWHSEIWFKS